MKKKGEKKNMKEKLEKIIQDLQILDKDRDILIEKRKRYAAYEDLFFCPDPIKMLLDKNVIKFLLEGENMKYWTVLKEFTWIFPFINIMILEIFHKFPTMITEKLRDLPQTDIYNNDRSILNAIINSGD